jgi:hypothetical protein
LILIKSFLYVSCDVTIYVCYVNSMVSMQVMYKYSMLSYMVVVLKLRNDSIMRY